MIWLLLALFLGLSILYRCVNLLKNYMVARKLGLPIMILPASFDEFAWIILMPFFGWVRRLPFGLGSWYNYADFGWPMIDRTKIHTKLGNTFALVSPTSNQIITAYPPAAAQIYRDYKVWIKAPALQAMFGLYGPHVGSVNYEDWQRHRKITAPAFNDRNFSYVWTESIRQCRDWLVASEQKRGGLFDLSDVKEDFDILSMHVLAAVGFDSPADFASGVQQQRPQGHRLTFMDALGTILKDLNLTLLFGGVKLPSALQPAIMKRVQLAINEFKLYMEESVLRQMKLAHSTTGNSVSLVGAIVKANEDEKQQKQNQSQRLSYLSNEEVYGNLYLFNLAGFETVAGTMTFAVPFLAAYPELQAWIREEVDAQYTDSASAGSYNDTFHKMTRCLAFMYETLRTRGPAPQMVRIAETPQELPISPHASVTVPPNTHVSAHLYHVHLNPATWGADAAEFNPKRFVRADPSGVEHLAAPPEGAAFIPWLVGPRACPGKRFSQVEFVAVVCELLRGYEVQLRVEPGEQPHEARARLLQVTDEFVFHVSPHMTRPKDAGVRMVPRKLE